MKDEAVKPEIGSAAGETPDKVEDRRNASDNAEKARNVPEGVGIPAPGAENHPCKEHEELVREIIETLPDDDTLDELEELFKIFGDSTRIKILYVLHEGELCVCDIASMLGMNQSAISHQLRVLRQTRLIKSRREGKNIYYSLADEHVHTIISMGIEHISE